MTGESTGRRPRDRDGTEAKLLATARRILERDGVLAGLNLREVADEAGVNRALVYRYFGSRKGLLRAALADMAWGRAQDVRERANLPFAQRRLLVFQQALDRVPEIQVAALLALDGERDLRLFPALDQAVTELERDKEIGELAPDADGLALHVLTAATYLGYCVFRDEIAEEVGVSPEDLDRRVGAAFEQLVEGVTVRKAPAGDTEAGE